MGCRPVGDAVVYETGMSRTGEADKYLETDEVRLRRTALLKYDNRRNSMIKNTSDNFLRKHQFNKYIILQNIN